MKLNLNTRPDGSKIYYAETEGGQYDAVSEDAMGAVWQVANLMEEELHNAKAAADNRVKVDFNMSNNGDILATTVDDDILLGVWIASKLKGTYRIGSGKVPDADAAVSHLGSLTNWIGVMSGYVK